MEVENLPRFRKGKPLSLSTAIQTSFGPPHNPDYVLDIAASDDNSLMAVSLSSKAIKLYSPITGQPLGECLGHTGPITDLVFPDPINPHMLSSSSIDGTVRVWDTRSHCQVGTLRTGDPCRELYSLSIGGSSRNIVAAGANARVLCWDWRTKNVLACMEECHTEDVTQVRFHPDKRDKLLSASVDGLMCVFDTHGEINDDEGLDIVMNVGSSIGKIGFYGISNEKIWCTTHIETLSLWNFEEGRKEAEFSDTRSMASLNWEKPPVDYLVGVHYSSINGDLWLLAGTKSGLLGYFPLKYNMSYGDSVSSAGIVGPVSAILEGGHTDIVRTVWSPFSKNSGAAELQGLFCWTGGEDGCLCGWFESCTNQAWVSSRLVRKKSDRKKHRHQPY